MQEIWEIAFGLVSKASVMLPLFIAWEEHVQSMSVCRDDFAPVHVNNECYLAECQGDLSLDKTQMPRFLSSLNKL